jgi:ATP-dependent Lon protease
VSEVPAFRIEIGGQFVEIPAELPLLPIRNSAVFPGTTRPLSVGRARSLAAVRESGRGDGFIAILTQRVADVEDPRQEDLYDVGTVCKVLQIVDSGNGISVIVVGLTRFRVLEVAEADEMLKARLEVLPDRLEDTAEAEAARRTVQRLAKELVGLRDDLPDDLQEVLNRIEDPARLADLVGFGANLPLEEKIALLRQPDVLARLRVLIRHLMREVRVAQVSRSFAERAAGEIDERQRKTMLREQLRKIQEELGEADDQAAEADELRERIEQAALPESVREVTEREANRLAAMPAHSPERSVIRTYVEWILDLPWEEETEDNLDIAHARVILDEDHYGLDNVKERILEYLAVRRLVEAPRGPILCFLGPPGVGKTSLGKSIARAMGRKFIRASLGGVRDEAEIRGHRRTYVGALPGRILQNLKRAGSRNPVFMLDEIDKVGMDYRGDPSSALLEVLDPEQNSSFSDHYLELPFDLSHVLFVTTANRTDTIPPPLLDRMELIELPGYTAREKLRIAKAFLAPRQLEEHGLEPDAFSISDEALLRIIEGYTREAGVRNLERRIAALVRKSALRAAEGEKDEQIQADDLSALLGPPSFTREVAERIDRPGVSMGLVWTPVGGDIVFVEAALMEGQPKLSLTGQLGDVMRESADAALSYLQANAEALGIDAAIFEKHQIHIHVPAGGLKKDGPSAGITLLVALASLLTGRHVRGPLAMTGEITLRGQVLPVGGIKEKVLAAHRAGIEEIILPTRNEKDLEEVPEEVREALKVHVVDHVRDAIRIAIPSDD